MTINLFVAYGKDGLPVAVEDTPIKLAHKLCCSYSYVMKQLKKSFLGQESKIYCVRTEWGELDV